MTHPHAAAFSADGAVLASARDGNVLLWDVRSPAHPRALGGISVHPQTSRLALDDDGARLATVVAGFSRMHIHATASGALLHELGTRGAVTCFTFATHGRFVIGEVERMGEQRSRSFVTIVDLVSGAELSRTVLLDLPLREIACSSDGLLLFLGFGGGVVVVFDVQARRELLRFPSLDAVRDASEIGERMAASFSFSHDGRCVALQWGSTVEIWPLDGAARVSRIHLDERAWSVALSHDGSRVIVGAPAAGMWSVDGTKLKHLDVAHDVIATPDGLFVLSNTPCDGQVGPSLLATAP